MEVLGKRAEILNCILESDTFIGI